MSSTNGRNLDDPRITEGLDDAYRVSWYGYIWPLFRHVLIGIGLLFSLVIFPPAGVVLLLGWFVSLIVRIASIRSIRLYANQAGIWHYRGVFPWSKSINGVRWHNVDEATSNTGFMSWATRSYLVRVTNLYTKRLGIWIPRISRGDEFVARVNAVIGQRHAGGPIIQPITQHKQAQARLVAVAPTAIE